MRQSIETKYLGPTNYRGSRIKATTASGHSLTVDFRSELSVDENHKEAALKLCEKLGWAGKVNVGSTPKGCVFVFSDYDSFVIIPSSGAV